MTRSLVIAALAASLLGAPELARPCGLEWAGELSAALQKTGGDKSLVLVFVTGMDWSPRSILLDQKVWEDSDFNAYSSAHFVLVNMDFPQRTTLAPEILKRQTAFAETHRVRGFPVILALTPDGREFARLEYTGQSAAQMTALLEEWHQAHTSGRPVDAERIERLLAAATLAKP